MLHHFFMGLRPIHPAPHLPTVDYVADQKELIAGIVLEEFEQL
jgi:hypothetical protein